MNINTTKTINTHALKHLADLFQLSDDDLDNYILKTREKFMKYQDIRISEAFPKIVDGYDMEAVMLGAIMAIFTSDYIFKEYFNGDVNEN